MFSTVQLPHVFPDSAQLALKAQSFSSKVHLYPDSIIELTLLAISGIINSGTMKGLTSAAAV